MDSDVESDIKGIDLNNPVEILENDLNNGKVLTNRLYRYALRFTKGSPNWIDNAEEIMQEFYLKVIQKKRIYDAKKDCKNGWFFILLHNTAMDFFRCKKRRIYQLKTKVSSKKEVYDFFEQCSIDEPFRNPLQNTSTKENTEIIQRGLHNIPLGNMDILVQRYFEDASYKKIASVKKISIGTVKSKLNYAKKQLRKKLECLAIMDEINKKFN